MYVPTPLIVATNLEPDSLNPEVVLVIANAHFLSNHLPLGHCTEALDTCPLYVTVGVPVSILYTVNEQDRVSPLLPFIVNDFDPLDVYVCDTELQAVPSGFLHATVTDLDVAHAEDEEPFPLAPLHVGLIAVQLAVTLLLPVILVVDSTLVLANSTSGGFMYIEGDNVKVLNSSMMFSSS